MPHRHIWIGEIHRIGGTVGIGVGEGLQIHRVHTELLQSIQQGAEIGIFLIGVFVVNVVQINVRGFGGPVLVGVVGVAQKHFIFQRGNRKVFFNQYAAQSPQRGQLGIAAIIQG